MERDAVKRRQVCLTMLPDVYERLQGIAESAELSCSRMVEVLVLRDLAATSRLDPQTAKRLLAISKWAEEDVETVLAQVISVGLRYYEDESGVSDILSSAEAVEAADRILCDMK